MALIRAMIVVARAHLLPAETMAGQHSLELGQDICWHLGVVLESTDDNSAGIVQDGQAATPEHEGVVRMGPGHQSPVLGLGYSVIRYCVKCWSLGLNPSNQISSMRDKER